MRISTERNAPGYHTWLRMGGVAARWTVTLDGNPVANVISADEEAGEVVVTRMVDGHPVVNAAGDALEVDTLRGAVVVAHEAPPPGAADAPRFGSAAAERATGRKRADQRRDVRAGCEGQSVVVAGRRLYTLRGVAEVAVTQALAAHGVGPRRAHAAAVNAADYVLGGLRGGSQRDAWALYRWCGITASGDVRVANEVAEMIFMTGGEGGALVFLDLAELRGRVAAGLGLREVVT